MPHFHHITNPRVGAFAPVTSPDHRMAWSLRQLDHVCATETCYANTSPVRR